jgi:hypothetical protein
MNIPNCEPPSKWMIKRCVPGQHLPGTPINIKGKKFAGERSKREGCDRPHCPHCLFHLDEPLLEGTK